MAGKNLDRLLVKAEKAYRKKDRRKGARLVDEILQQDFNHAGVWRMLHQQYGENQGFESFRLAFVKKYYPRQIHFIQEIPAGAAPEKQKRPSLIARILSVFRKKENPAPYKPEIPQPPVIPIASYQPVKSPAPNQEKPASTGKIRVLVVDDIAETRENIIRSLLFSEDIEVIGTADNGLRGIEQTKLLQPEVVLMDVNMPDMDGITATAAIRREAPATQVIILTVQDDIDYMRNAMLAGARDFLAKPPMIDELASAVRRAGAYARQELSKSQPDTARQPIGSGTSQVASGKIFSIYSPRGGAGCTTISANLAVSLNREETPVVIVDGNLQFGDIPVFYNTQGTHSILDLAPHVDELDSETVEKVLIQHESGVRILAPTRPEDAEKISGEQFQKLLQVLARLYSYVLVDLPAQLNDTTLAALEVSDLVILVVTQDIPAIARARKFIDLAPLINLDPDRVLIVVNQFDKRVGITSEKLAETLKKEIAAVIPLAGEVVVPSINRGVPFMLQKQILTQPVGRSILDMVEAVRQKASSLEPKSVNKIRKG